MAALPIYKQQVLFHFISIFTHILDADGLRDYVILHSKYNVVHEGMQSKDRYFIPPNQSIEDIPTDIQHLFICRIEEYREEKLILSTNSFHQLISITIGNGCFKNVCVFVLDGLESLESVKIGGKCFRISDDERDDGVCQITNCPNLRQLEIGDYCFQHVREFVIDGLDNLESVQIGGSCFRISDDERDDGVCRITNCPNLRQLEIGGYSFYYFNSFELSNLNSIQSIKFGWRCFKYADCSLKGE